MHCFTVTTVRSVYSDCSRQQTDINCTVEIFIGRNRYRIAVSCCCDFSQIGLWWLAKLCDFSVKLLNCHLYTPICLYKLIFFSETIVAIIINFTYIMGTSFTISVHFSSQSPPQSTRFSQPSVRRCANFFTEASQHFTHAAFRLVGVGKTASL
jgi:hypothetical protein